MHFTTTKRIQNMQKHQNEKNETKVSELLINEFFISNFFQLFFNNNGIVVFATI